MRRIISLIGLMLAASLACGGVSAQPSPSGGASAKPPNYISRDLVTPGAPIRWREGGVSTPSGVGGSTGQSTSGGTVTPGNGEAATPAPSTDSRPTTIGGPSYTTPEDRRKWRQYIETDGNASVFGGTGEYTSDKTLRNVKSGRRQTEDGKWDVDPTVIKLGGEAVLSDPSFSKQIGDGTLQGGFKRAEASGNLAIHTKSATVDGEVGVVAFWANYTTDKTTVDFDAFAADFKAHGDLDAKKMKAEGSAEVGVYLVKASAEHRFDVGPLELMVGVHGAVGAAAGVEGKFDLKKKIARWSWTTVLGVGGGFDFGLEFKEEPDLPPVVPVGSGARP